MTSTYGYAQKANRHTAGATVLGLAVLLGAALLALPAFARTAEAASVGDRSVADILESAIPGDPPGTGGTAYQDEEPTATPTPQLYVEEEDRREDVIIPMAIIIFLGVTVLGILFGVYGFLRE